MPGHFFEGHPVSEGTTRTLRGLQETRVATREESGVLGFPSCWSSLFVPCMKGALRVGCAVPAAGAAGRARV